MIVIQIRRQKSFEMAFVQNDNVVQKLSAKANDYAFNVGVLPRRARCCDHVIDTKRLNPTSNPLTVKAIAVS